MKNDMLKKLAVNLSNNGISTFRYDKRIVKQIRTNTIDKNISFSELESIAKSIKCNILKDINLFDVYTGDKLPENKKSYSLSFIFEDNSKTLTDIQIDKIMGKLIKEYKKGVSAEIR